MIDDVMMVHAAPTFCLRKLPLPPTHRLPSPHELGALHLRAIERTRTARRLRPFLHLMCRPIPREARTDENAHEIMRST